MLAIFATASCQLVIGSYGVEDGGGESRPESGKDVSVAGDATDARESGTRDAARVDAGDDVSGGGKDAVADGNGGLDGPMDVMDTGHDAGHDVVPPMDAPPPVDTGCSMFVATGPSVCGTATPPETFCTYFEISSSYLTPTTPALCRCATTYTCACLYVYGVDTSAFCAGGGLPVSCTDDPKAGPNVVCP